MQGSRPAACGSLDGLGARPGQGEASDLLPGNIDVHDLNAVRVCVSFTSFAFSILG